MAYRSLRSLTVAAPAAVSWSRYGDGFGNGLHTLLIPGTGDLGHLEENIAAGEVVLDGEAVAALSAAAPSQPRTGQRH